MDTQLKDKTKSFRIQHRSEIDGQLYEGHFTTQKLSIGKIMELGVVKAQLTGGFSYNPQSGRGISMLHESLADMVATCQVALIQKPKWFDDPLKLEDIALIRMVFEEVNSFEESFRAPDAGEDGQGGEGGRSGDGQADRQGQSGSQMEHQEQQHGGFEAMVDKKVPSISKVG